MKPLRMKNTTIHHRSPVRSWEVNGYDFGRKERISGKSSTRVLQIKSAKEVGVIQSTNQWVAADGTVV